MAVVLGWDLGSGIVRMGVGMRGWRCLVEAGLVLADVSGCLGAWFLGDGSGGALVLGVLRIDRDWMGWSCLVVLAAGCG